MIPDDFAVNSFLRLGYFIDFADELAPIDFSLIDKSRFADSSPDELVTEGADALRRTFDGLWVQGRDHVVPLSGGLDSRLILGALLEHTEAANLHTYTFGIPGAYDFEIGNSVAQAVGSRHISIPLNGGAWTVGDELKTADRTYRQGVLFHHPPLQELDRRYGGALFWSGYVGDAVAGSHLHDPPSASLDDAKRRHLRNRTFVRSARLHRLPGEAFLSGMGGGFADPDILSWDEQVLFGEAVPKFTAPLVLFRGFDFVTPLINTPWMELMFSVPNRFRLGERLMIEVGRLAYPFLFDIPTKNRLGHSFDALDAAVRATFWMNRVRKLTHQFFPWVNYPPVQYADFNEEIRNNPSFRQVVRSSIEDLRKRGICDWVDFEGIWRRHDWRMRNHGDALIVLASLELILKAREQGARE